MSIIYPLQYKPTQDSTCAYLIHRLRRKVANNDVSQSAH